MRFAVPIHDPKEIIPLKEAGCDEFYLGYLEEAWQTRYGNHDSISRRQGAANVRTPQQLKDILAGAADAGIAVYLALNSRYTPLQYSYLEDLCFRFARWGGTGVILQDTELLRTLQGHHFPLRYTASILTVTVNADGVRFLRDLGAQRIVLPRFLRPDEMIRIAAKEPDMEYEVMVMGDRCPMIDGLCRSFHGQEFAKTGPETDASGSFFTFDTACKARHLCVNIPGKADPCAACLIRDFEKAGIRIMKFGGRGTPLEKRLTALRFFSSVRAMSGACEDTGKIRQLYKSAFGHDCHCYYEKPLAEPAQNPEIRPITSGAGKTVNLGHISCPKEFRKDVRALRINTQVSGQIRFTVPPVTPDLEDAFDLLLELAAERENMELVLNDWGSLYRCCRLKKEKKLNLFLTAGVLLAGQDTDPVLRSFCRRQPDQNIWSPDTGTILKAVWKPPASELLEHWRTPSVYAFAPYLKKTGVTGLEICSQPFPFPEEAPALPVRVMKESIVSVLPCSGNCVSCKGGSFIRGEITVKRDRNLLLASFSP